MPLASEGHDDSLRITDQQGIGHYFPFMDSTICDSRDKRSSSCVRFSCSSWSSLSSVARTLAAREDKTVRHSDIALPLTLPSALVRVPALQLAGRPEGAMVGATDELNLNPAMDEMPLEPPTLPDGGRLPTSDS